MRPAPHHQTATPTELLATERDAHRIAAHRAGVTAGSYAWLATNRMVRPMHERLRSIEERYASPQVLTLGRRDERWLGRARRAAQSVDGRWRVGCVIVRGNRVLAVAANTERNQPGVLDGCLWHMSVHAEIAALRQVAQPRGASVFVARIGRDGADRHAQPCARCHEALAASAVGTVRWTCDSDYVATRRAGPAASSDQTHPSTLSTNPRS